MSLTKKQITNKLISDNKLKPNDVAVISEYLTNGFIQWKAYKAGHTKCNDESCRVEAAKYFAKPNVKESISNVLDYLLDGIKHTLHYQIIKTYRNRAFYNVDDIIDDDGNMREDLSEDLKCVIDGVEHKPMLIGSGENAETLYTKKYTLANRDKALEQLTKYMAIISDKLEISGKIETIAHPVAEQLKQIREQFKSK